MFKPWTNILWSHVELQITVVYELSITFLFPCCKKFICYMNKYNCHEQDVVLLRIVVLQRLGIFRIIYWRVVLDLNWPVYYRWVMGHMGHESIF